MLLLLRRITYGSNGLVRFMLKTIMDGITNNLQWGVVGTGRKYARLKIC